MKKIFTLIATALMAVGASAQMIKWDAAVTSDNLAADASWKSGNFKVAIVDTGNKMSIDGNNAYFGTADDNQKFTHRLKTGGKSSSTNQIIATIPSEGKLNIYVRTGSGSATDRNMIVTQGTTELFNKVIKENAATDYVTVGENKVFPIISVSVTEGDVVITYPVNGINFYAFEFISATAATDPVMTASPTAMSLAATPSQNTQSKTFTITGANLTPGTYNLTVPNLAGLSVEPTSFTVDSEGKANQEFTVTYSSTDDVAEATANITATVNGQAIAVAVTYSSRATLDEQVEVSTATTWDWSGMTDEVELTEETNPKRSDNPVMSNLTHLFDIPASFNAQAIQLIDTQFPVRGGCMQNGTASFRTTGTGVVTVTFSDTGSGASATAPERHLCINGVKQDIYTKRDGSVDKKTSEPIEIAAGKVTISGVDADGTTPQAIRIYTITFTPQDVTNPIPAATDAEPSDPTGINTVATDAAKANVVKKYVDGKQVVIEKNGKKYNVAGAQIK